MPTELNAYGLWGGAQAAKGTPAVSLPKRLRQVAGDLNYVRADGAENFSDLDQPFTDTTDWVDTISGTGAPGIESTPEELAWLLWLFHGGETTSAITGPPAKTRHVFTPLPGLGLWGSFQKRLGVTAILRELYQDCQVSQLQIEGSTGTKPVRTTPSLISLDPAIKKTADPAAAMTAKEPFLYTDGVGTFKIDNVVIPGHQQFTFIANRDYQPVQGDDSLIYDLAQGNAVATIGVAMVADAAAVSEYNQLVYGSAAPATGTKPRKGLTAQGSYAYVMAAKDPVTGIANGDKFDLTIPAVKWQIPDYPGPNPDGGPASLELAGAMRKLNASTPAYTIGVECDAAAFTGAG